MGSDLEVFKKCTIETNILMGTSTTFDDKGNTITILPSGEISDTELMFGNDPLRVLVNKKAQKGTAEEKKVGRRGVNKRQLCRNLLTLGKPDQEITQELAARYLAENVEEKIANRRADDILKQVKAAANKTSKDRHIGQNSQLVKAYGTEEK